MPTYDYRCPECEHVGWELHGHDERPRILCPQCGTRMNRLFPAPKFWRKGQSYFRRRDLNDGFGADNKARASARAAAAAAGVSTTGKSFQPGLAEYPDDPKGWVADQDEAIAKLKARNLSCEALGVEGTVADAPHPLEVPYECAPDIIEKQVHVTNVLEYGGRMPEKEKQHLREDLATRAKGNG